MRIHDQPSPVTRSKLLLVKTGRAHSVITQRQSLPPDNLYPSQHSINILLSISSHLIHIHLGQRLPLSLHHLRLLKHIPHNLLILDPIPLQHLPHLSIPPNTIPHYSQTSRFRKRHLQSSNLIANPLPQVLPLHKPSPRPLQPNKPPKQSIKSRQPNPAPHQTLPIQEIHFTNPRAPQIDRIVIPSHGPDFHSRQSGASQHSHSPPPRRVSPAKNFRRGETEQHKMYEVPSQQSRDRIKQPALRFAKLAKRTAEQDFGAESGVEQSSL